MFLKILVTVLVALISYALASLVFAQFWAALIALGFAAAVFFGSDRIDWRR